MSTYFAGQVELLECKGPELEPPFGCEEFVWSHRCSDSTWPSGHTRVLLCFWFAILELASCEKHPLVCGWIGPPNTVAEPKPKALKVPWADETVGAEDGRRRQKQCWFAGGAWYKQAWCSCWQVPSPENCTLLHSCFNMSVICLCFCRCGTQKKCHTHTHMIDVCWKLLYTSTFCQVAGADVGFVRRPWRMCRGARNWTTQLTGCFKTLSHWNRIWGWETTSSLTVTKRILAVLVGESLQTFYLALLLGRFWHPNFFSDRTWSFDHRCSNRLGQEEKFPKTSTFRHGKWTYLSLKLRTISELTF